jgi:hypothetical protein
VDLKYIRRDNVDDDHHKYKRETAQGKQALEVRQLKFIMNVRQLISESPGN